MGTARKIVKKEYKLVKHDSDFELKKKWTRIKDIFTNNKNVLITVVSSFREKNNIGVNEFCKNIDMTSRQYLRLMDNSENITLMTIAEIAEFMNCDLEISFKKRK
ncbi:hypothetical protein [Spirobacillus cienkowskii]|uniref:hypothetical protein n=1 Tax=Spirobacillus cienkowskii TaxID=495820 RepID=UPI0030D55785